VRPQLPSERDHGIADGVMLLSTLCAAFVTWRYLANISAGPLWKFYCGVGLTFVLALAGLTRRARWADSIRLLMGIWTIIAPFMLGLTEVAPFWIYLTMGALLTALSIPGVVGENGRDLAQPRSLGLCHCHLDLRLSPSGERSPEPSPERRARLLLAPLAKDGSFDA
jgi:hypothetical protein